MGVSCSSFSSSTSAASLDATEAGADGQSGDDRTADANRSSAPPVSSANPDAGRPTCLLHECVDIAVGQSNPTGIVSNNTSVYWTNEADNGSVATCSVSGCSAGARTPDEVIAVFGGPNAVLLATSIPAVRLFAATNSNGLVAVPVDAGSGLSISNPGGTITRDVWPSGNYLYMATPTGGPGPIWSCGGPTTGTCNNGDGAVFPGASPNSIPAFGTLRRLAFAAGRFWFSTNTGVWSAPGQGQPASGSISLRVAANANAIVVSSVADRIYWSVDGPAGAVFSAPLTPDGKMANVLPTPIFEEIAGSVAGMVLDGNVLYFADSVAGRIYRYIPATQSVDLVIDGLKPAQGLAVDAKYVFATSGDGRVVRANKTF